MWYAYRQKQAEGWESILLRSLDGTREAAACWEACIVRSLGSCRACQARRRMLRSVRPRQRFRDSGLTDSMPMVAIMPEERVGAQGMRCSWRGGARYGSLGKNLHCLRPACTAWNRTPGTARSCVQSWNSKWVQRE